MIRVRPFAAAVLAIALAPVLTRAALSPETGSYIFRRYLPDQYGALPENWAIAQDRRGIMYFGNTDALLEFDGQSWRSIRLSNSSVVRAVTVDKGGTVYVGGQGIFGILKPDAAGNMQFVSLLDKVPAGDRKFSDVWRILPTSQGIYFSAYERLFRLNPDGSLKVWRPVSNFGRAIAIHDAIYVKTREKGLLRMDGNTLAPVPGGEVFQKLGVTAGASTQAGGMIATPAGFFRLDADGVKPFPTAADAYFAANLLYTFDVFPDGEIAAGTQKGGLVLVSGEGRIDRILTQADGLTGDYIAAIFRDRQGGVWLAGKTGITYLNPGLSRFGADLGLQGAVQCVVRAGGVVYAGTSAGLFALQTTAGEAPRFERIPGIDTGVSVVIPREGQLLAATDTGIFAVASGHAGLVLAPKDPVMNDVVVSMRDPSLVYAIGRAGVFVLQRRGTSWTKNAEFSAAGQQFLSAREDTDGRVWATTREAVWRIDFRGREVAVRKLHRSAGGARRIEKPATVSGPHALYHAARHSSLVGSQSPV